MSDWNAKRGLAAPLLFLALGAAAWGSVSASPSVWAASLISLGLAAWGLKGAAGGMCTTPLALAVLAFSAWLAASNALANPSYTPAAPYHAAFLLAGFLLACRAGERAAKLVFATALAFAVALAAWALWQRAQGAARATALFETPATLAAVLNLALLPCLAFVLAGKRRAALLGAGVVLAAALVAAQSRGGWLGLAGGLLAALYLRRRTGRNPGWRELAAVALVLGGGALLAGLCGLASEIPRTMTGEAAHGSSTERVALYLLAGNALLEDFRFTGSGYLAFYYLFEAARHNTGVYGEGATFFVHNDYLQVLLELGVPGLAALLALMALPLHAARKALVHLPALRATPVIAACSAIGSMAAHALVDFPFYVPLCLLLYGIALGALDAVLLASGHARAVFLPQAGVVLQAQRAGIAAVAVLGAWLLVTPLAGEVAAAHAQRRWRAANAESAAYWLEVARRIEPRDWRYHWYAGQFWFAQAAQNGNRTAARMAESAFANGFAANPREPRNQLGRVATRRQFGALLDAAGEAR